MPKNKVVGVDEAVAYVKSGMSIAIGGFLAQGDPLTVMHALKLTGVKDLTIYLLYRRFSRPGHSGVGEGWHGPQGGG